MATNYIGVQVFDDTLKYEERPIAGLTKRQLFCFIPAAVVSIALMAFLTKVMQLDMTTASYPVGIIATAIGIIPFVTPDDLEPQVFLKLVKHALFDKQILAFDQPHKQHRSKILEK